MFKISKLFYFLSFLLVFGCSSTGDNTKKDNVKIKYEKDFQKNIVDNYNRLSKLIVIKYNNDHFFPDYYVLIYLKTATNKNEYHEEPPIKMKINSIIDFRNALIYLEKDSVNKIPVYENGTRVQ